MAYHYAAAWVPYRPERDLVTAAAPAIVWAEQQATTHHRPVVLVTDRADDAGEVLFEPYRRGRHISPDMPGCDVRPGAVIAHAPTPRALQLAATLAADTALVVVEHPLPWRLTGWAGMLGALNLDTGQTSELAPHVREYIDELLCYGATGYTPGYGRNGAQRTLCNMAAATLLDRDVVLSALSARDITPAALHTISTLIDIVSRAATHH